MHYERKYKTAFALARKDGSKAEQAFLAATPYYKFCPLGDIASSPILHKNFSVSEPIEESTRKAVEPDGDGMRPLLFTITDNSVDHTGDKIYASGGETDWWKRAGSFLFGHSAWYPKDIMGRPLTVERMPVDMPTRVEALVRFIPERISKEAYSVYQMFTEGFLSGCSVGILIREWVAVEDRPGWAPWDIIRWFLLETSATPIPANPNALVHMGDTLGEDANKALEQMIDEANPNDPARDALAKAKHIAEGSPASISVPSQAEIDQALYEEQRKKFLAGLVKATAYTF